MLIDEMHVQNVSVAIAHYVYRNTVIEDYHSDEVRMDAELYQKMHRIVARKLNYVRRFYPLLLQMKDAEAWDQAARSFNSLIIAKEFASFSTEMLSRVKSNAGWDAAMELAQPLGKNLADFVLGGVFAQYCRDGARLSDCAMREINRDINNRIYTLLLRHVFE